jgi:hypothetical protein
MVLLLSLFRKRWSTWHWIALLFLIANLTLFNRGLVGGHTTGSALVTGSHFAPLLLLVLLGPCLAGRRFLKTSIAALLGLILFIPAPMHPSTGQDLLKWVNALPAKNRFEIPASWVRTDLERVGSIFLPLDQANSLADIVGFLEGESFWDFTDHGALYFLADQLSPTRFYATHHVITGENQREAIGDLERTRPRYIVYRSSTGWDTIAGIDRTLRSSLVSEYILRNYHYMGQVGGFTILERGFSPDPATDFGFRVDLGYVPFLWGRDRIEIVNELQPKVRARWVFSSADNHDDWLPLQQLSLLDARGEGKRMLSTGPDPQLQNSSVSLDPRSTTYCVLRMTASEAERGSLQAQLYWTGAGGGYQEEKSVRFGVLADGQEHLYLLRLAAFPSWAWSGPLAGLRLDPVDAAGVDVTIKSIEFIQVEELIDHSD